MLSPKQRQFLKGLAHPLSPVVRVGKGGITPSVVAEAKRSLEAHELIKVRIETDDSETRQELADKLAAATTSHIAAVIGKIAIFYREREENPRIKLPAT